MMNFLNSYKKNPKISKMMIFDDNDDDGGDENGGPVVIPNSFTFGKRLNGPPSHKYRNTYIYVCVYDADSI